MSKLKHLRKVMERCRKFVHVSSRHFSDTDYERSNLKGVVNNTLMYHWSDMCNGFGFTKHIA